MREDVDKLIDIPCKPYTPTRLDYFVLASVKSGSLNSMSYTEVVEEANQLIAEIDKEIENEK